MINFEPKFIAGVVNYTRFRYLNTSALVPLGIAKTTLPESRPDFNEWEQYVNKEVNKSLKIK